ncbi:BnaC06g06740D [Brassica napus]|uniref:BnaC06g06740D protein n=1 Tax=Brassica napus TaxID=3708 RepID=A0A078HFU6_BRANA|nr:BnaC06g06740D [Brassica napus]
MGSSYRNKVPVVTDWQDSQPKETKC